MKARRLPQDGIVLEVLENLQEIIWGKIASGVKGFIKSFIRDVDAALGSLFLKGVSTRKLKGIAREIYGKEVSSTLTSLDEELSRFKDKPIEDDIEFFFLDGLSQKVREIGIEKKVMLCAFGIHRKEADREQGEKNILFECLRHFDFDKELMKRVPTASCMASRIC